MVQIPCRISHATPHYIFLLGPRSQVRHRPCVRDARPMILSILCGCLTVQTGIVILTLIFHRDALAFTCRKFVPNFLRSLNEMSISHVPLFIWPWVNEFPLAFPFLFPFESLFKFFSSQLGSDLGVYFVLLACQYSICHLGLLLLQNLLTLAN